MENNSCIALLAKLVANPEFPNIVVNAFENSMPNRNQVPILYLYDVYLLARWRLFTGSKYSSDLIMFKNAGAFYLKLFIAFSKQRRYYLKVAMPTSAAYI